MSITFACAILSAAIVLPSSSGQGLPARTKDTVERLGGQVDVKNTESGGNQKNRCAAAAR